MSQVSAEFIPTRIAILTVSNRRGEEDDTSGHYLRDSAQEAGHQIVDKAIVKETRRRKRCNRCSTEKSKGLAKYSVCCRLKRLAPRRCNPARLPGWPIKR